MLNVLISNLYVNVTFLSIQLTHSTSHITTSSAGKGLSSVIEVLFEGIEVLCS